MSRPPLRRLVGLVTVRDGPPAGPAADDVPPVPPGQTTSARREARYGGVDEDVTFDPPSRDEAAQPKRPEM
jgi:hypothetical protein